jgi:Ala-tRNA(Pro) deacylase
MNIAIANAQPSAATTYTRLISLLDDAGARYRLIDHPPEGRTLEASALRGHPAPQAAKCMVARIKHSKKLALYALAVIPGDRRADLGRLSDVLGGRKASLAPCQTAETLTGCVIGSIVPFSFNPDLHLITDPDLLSHSELFFNAARLDRSVALATKDYVALAKPRIEPISTPCTHGIGKVEVLG